MPSIKLILTFDYELPLGSVKKSFQHALFEPTERLFEVLDKLNVPAVFFSDILSYVKFKEWGITEYTVPFDRQMKQALNKGYDVQLHLHPHWLESKFVNGRIVASEKFKLGDFYNMLPPNDINSLIEKSIEELTNILKIVSPDYKCVAYRAGGYNFEPYASEIIKALYDNGIYFDSSVSRGYFFKSNTSLVDYRYVPDLPNWFLSFDGNFAKKGDTDNAIYEIPIASKPKGLFEVPTSFKLKKYAFRAVEDRGTMIHQNEEVSKADRLKQLFSSRMLSIDNHTYSPEYLMKILDYNVNKFKKHNVIIMSLIGHPKSLDKYHFFLLSEFIKRSSEKYGYDLEFVTFADLLTR